MNPLQSEESNNPLRARKSKSGDVYHRYTRGDVDNGVGYMMYARNQHHVDTAYGKNHYVIDIAKIHPSKIVDADSDHFRDKVREAFEDAEHLQKRYQATPDQLVGDIAPERIVDSAGVWDSPDLVEHIYNSVLEPHGWTTVRTPDGVVSFDREDAERAP